MNKNLYRGKSINDGTWYEGSLLVFTNTGRTKILKWNNADLDFDQIEVDPETVGQYTGFNDKNDKKIFEGDIINASNEWWDAAGYAGHNSPIILVQWNQGECRFSPFSTYDSDCGVSIDANNCEVIGNIYDNSEIKYCD